MPLRWTEHELSEQEVSSLTAIIQEKIAQAKAYELLSYYGLLYFKDKIWEGKVFRLEETEVGEDSTLKEDEGRPIEVGEDSTLKADGGRPTHAPIYLLEFHLKVIEEMKNIIDPKVADAVRLLTLFDLNGGSDNAPCSLLSESSSQGLYELVYSQYKDFSTDISSVALRHGLFQNLRKFLAGKSFQTSVKAVAFGAVLRDEQSAKFLSAPSTVTGYEIKKMDPHQTLYALKLWKFASAGTNLLFLNSVHLGLAFGAFPIGSDKPVGWALVSWLGAISALHVLTEHRGRGVAKAIMKNAALEMIQRSLTPFVYIEDIETSVVPVSLFSGLGFEIDRDIKFYWGFSRHETVKQNKTVLY